MLRAFDVAALHSQTLWKGWQSAQLLPVPAEPGSLHTDKTLFVQYSQNRPAKASPFGRGGSASAAGEGGVRKITPPNDDKMPRQMLCSICRGGLMGL